METKKIIQSVKAPSVENYWFDLNDNRLKRFTAKGWETIKNSDGEEFDPTQYYNKSQVDSLVDSKASKMDLVITNQTVNGLTATVRNNYSALHSEALRIEADSNNKINTVNSTISEIEALHSSDINNLNIAIQDCEKISKAYTDSQMASVLNYKGVFDSLDSISTKKKGDVVTLSSEDFAEYVYNGSSWEYLGKKVDLSNLESRMNNVEGNFTSLSSDVNRKTTETQNDLNTFKNNVYTKTETYTQKQIDDKIAAIPAGDSDSVKIWGNQTISGEKTFTNPLYFNDGFKLSSSSNYLRIDKNLQNSEKAVSVIIESSTDERQPSVVYTGEGYGDQQWRCYINYWSNKPYSIKENEPTIVTGGAIYSHLAGNYYDRQTIDQKIAQSGGGGASSPTGIFTDIITTTNSYLLEIMHNYVVAKVSNNQDCLLLPEGEQDAVIIIFNASNSTFNIGVKSDRNHPINQYECIICTRLDGEWSVNSRQFNHVL